MNGGEEALSPHAWRRLVVLAPNWLGDAVMSEPTIRALGAQLPDLEITWAGNRLALAALRGHPAITNFVPIEDRGVRALLGSSRSLRNLKGDAMLVLRGSARSGIVARLCACPVRIGLGGEGRRLLLTHPIPRTGSKRPRPTVDLYPTLVAPIGIEVSDRTPRLTPSKEEHEQAARLFGAIDGPVLGIVPGGSKAMKRWPADRFRAVMATVGSRFAAVAVFGGPDERELVRSIVEHTTPTTPLIDLPAAGLSLENLRGAVARCRLLLTNDTGPRHLAIGLQVPTVALFGPTDHRWTSIPTADERILLAEPFLDESHSADEHPRACRIDRIPVADVVHSIVNIVDSE